MDSTIFTIGHSTRAMEEFIGLLQAHSVELLIDVRTIPRSRHNPQFNFEALSSDLQRAGIACEHAPGLGGLRRPRPNSRNTAWRNASFRGYADYMETSEFRENLARLIQQATIHRTAIMCAEALWWRCHRSLIADALTVRGVVVLHIESATKLTPHRLTSFASVNGSAIVYDAAQPMLPEI